ncbi:MAG: PAS domain S-box protein [Anaerolineaceae bacterium]|nr:PAS domain S-box protein [Anaerolineaceae bacterium]
MIRLPESDSVRINPYAVAIMMPILALLASLLFAPYLVRTTLLFFIIAVLISGWYGGVKHGLLSGLISGIFLDYFFLGTGFSFGVAVTDIPVIGLFALIVLIISIMEESRLRTERALRQSRDQLQVVLQSITDGVTAQSPNGELLFANESAARFAGFNSSTEMIATPISKIRSNYKIFDDDNKPLAFEKHPISRVFKEAKTSEMNFKWYSVPNDSTHWMNFKASPVFDQNGHVEMSINIMKDITEDKEAEVKLRNAHTRLQTMLASINNGVIATDAEGRVELINPMAEKLTGWKQEEALGKPFEDIVSIISEHKGKLIFNPIPTVLKDAVPVDVSTPSLLINKDKTEVPIGYNVAPIKDQFGAIVGAVMVFRDISDRQKAEKERNQLTMLLAAQQKRLENILANIPGIVWESILVPGSDTQRLEFVNSYAEKMLGYPRENWLTIPNFGQKITYPDDIETSQKEAREIYERGDLSASIQFRMIAKNGRIVPVEAHYSILTDENGQIIGTCGLIMDISQRKADEMALQQSTLDLTRSNEQLEQFAYVASHDLQEPLRMITSYLQLLERRYKSQLDQDATDFIAYAVDGATRMKALINDLLAYSRVKTGEQNFAQFDSTKALEQAITNLQMQIKETAAEITYGSLPGIVGNEAQFVQLFQNLLSNSIKFHGENPPKVKVSAELNGNVWKFSIQDNGIGIEPQYVDRIFIIFQRLHTKDRYPGTGIGLAICKKVVEHHGGRIWAESTPGTGTTFWFTVPSTNWRK